MKRSALYIARVVDMRLRRPPALHSVLRGMFAYNSRACLSAQRRVQHIMLDGLHQVLIEAHIRRSPPVIGLPVA